MSAHSINDLLTLLRAFGISNKPGCPGNSLMHAYAQKLALQSPRKPILGILEKDTRIYFQTVRRATRNRRSAFILEHPSLGLIVVLLSYRGLKTRLHQSSQTHSLSRSSEENAYDRAIVHVFAFEQAKNYVQHQLLKGLAYPFKGHFFAVTDSLLLVESVRMFLVEGASIYRDRLPTLIAENAELISSAHQLACIQYFNDLLNKNKMPEAQAEEILYLLRILIKYAAMKKGQLEIENKRYETPAKKLLAAQALQQLCFQQKIPLDVFDIGAYLALTGPLQLLDILHILHVAPDGTELVNRLQAKKETQQTDLERWLESLENAIPETPLSMQIWHGVCYCIERTYIGLNAQLAAFALRQLDSGMKSTKTKFSTLFSSPVNARRAQRKESRTIFAQPVVQWLACLSSAGFGLWYMCQLGAFVVAYGIGIILLAELLYNSLKFPQAEMDTASWTPHEKVLPEFLTVLCGVLWVSSFIPTWFADDSVYVKEMTLTVVLTLLLQKFFVWLKNVPSTSLMPDQAISGFLFTQFFLACLADIRNRGAQQEEITENLRAQNIDTLFYWYNWWFLPAYFQSFKLMHQNDTHLRIMNCAPTSAVRYLPAGVDVRAMSDCVLEREFVPKNDFRSNFSLTI